MSDQTPAQRMAELADKSDYEPHRLNNDDVLWLLDRCRKLERIADSVRILHTIDPTDGIGECQAWCDLTEAIEDLDGTSQLEASEAGFGD